MFNTKSVLETQQKVVASSHQVSVLEDHEEPTQLDLDWAVQLDQAWENWRDAKNNYYEKLSDIWDAKLQEYQSNHENYEFTDVDLQHPSYLYDDESDEYLYYFSTWEDLLNEIK